MVIIMTGAAQWHILCTSWARLSSMASEREGQGATTLKVSHEEQSPSLNGSKMAHAGKDSPRNGKRKAPRLVRSSVVSVNQSQ